MKCVTKFTARCLTILWVFGLLVATAAAGNDKDGPSPEGIFLTVKKTTYHKGEMVMFKLTKSDSLSYPSPANLEGSYYRIARREGNHGVEFYTSEKEPCGNYFSRLEEHVWSWNQKDNEQQHEAHVGEWRLRFYTPAASSQPLDVYFRVVE